MGFFRLEFYGGHAGSICIYGNHGRKIKTVFKSPGLPVINIRVVFLAVTGFPDLHSKATAFNTEGIGTHGCKLFGDRMFYRIDSREDTHKSHNSKGNNEDGKYGSEKVC